MASCIQMCLQPSDANLPSYDVASAWPRHNDESMLAYSEHLKLRPVSSFVISRCRLYGGADSPLMAPLFAGWLSRPAIPVPLFSLRRLPVRIFVPFFLLFSLLPLYNYLYE